MFRKKNMLFEHSELGFHTLALSFDKELMLKIASTFWFIYKNGMSEGQRNEPEENKEPTTRTALLPTQKHH